MDDVILNAEQKEAVEYGAGPLLIVAGAGTGKTTVITERFKLMIARGIVAPDEVLALTFTEKAAHEMEERIDKSMPYGCMRLFISTFHSFCDQVLRENAIHIGLDPHYKLMTSAEAVGFVKEHLGEFDFEYFRPYSNPNRFLESLVYHFGRLKDEDISVNDYFSYYRRLCEKERQAREDRVELRKVKELVNAYRVYEQLKIDYARMDFADLIAKCLFLFRERPNVLSRLRKKFRAVLVDEFQDTNYAQYELIKLLAPAGKDCNLTVCGDDSQSIYKFRGAAVSNILVFRKDYKDMKMVVLTKNYRSIQKILDVAYRLIKHNNPDTLEEKLGISKNLRSQVEEKKNDGVFFLIGRDEAEEAERVVGEIIRLVKKDTVDLADIAILVRANDHARSFIAALQRHGVKYQFLGPDRLLKQPEIKDLIAYLKLLYNLNDDVAMWRLLSSDFVALSGKDMALIRSWAKKNVCSYFEACEQLVEQAPGKFSSQGREVLGRLTSMINRHLQLAIKESAGRILYLFLEETGQLKRMAEANKKGDERRVQNISRFFEKLRDLEIEKEGGRLEQVVDWFDFMVDMGDYMLRGSDDWARDEGVNILTVHSAKGLEFEVVFLVNLVSGRFPTYERKVKLGIADELCKEILPEGDAHTQEERRLFYVGITRAKTKLYLTWADYYGQGKRKRKISPFVVEAWGRMPTFSDRPKILQLSIFDFRLSDNNMGVHLESERSRVKREVNYLSYSQISTYRICPLQYKYCHVLRIPVLPSSDQVFGIVIHNSLRDLYRKRIEGLEASLNDLLELFENNWRVSGFLDKAHARKSFLKGKRLLRAYWERFYDPSVLPLAVEEIFSLPLTSRLRVGGRIDRVDLLDNGGIEIIDYKTGKAKEQKLVNDDMQLAIYGLAGVDRGIYNRKADDVVLSFIYLDEGKKLSSRRSESQLREVREEIIKTASEIENSDFKPRPSMMCDWCSYKMICDAWR